MHAKLAPKWLILILIWAASLVAVLPAIFHWQPHLPPAEHGRHLPLDLGYAVALVICYWMYRVEASHLRRSHAIGVVFLVLLVTAIVNTLHLYNVDRGSIFPHESNLEWQLRVHEQVLQLSSSVVPHSYRFLPNSIVRWMELAGVAYEPARDIYRLLFNLLLFYAIYRYARLHTDFAGSLIALLFTAAIYPIGFVYSAGQLTDPLSHLSFVLAFIFLDTGDFAYFLTTLLIGSLAKETVLAMAGFYILFCRRDRNYAYKAAMLCVSCAAMYIGVRLFVLHGSMRYEQISGVAASHTWMNLSNGRWAPLFVLTGGALFPFLILNWNRTAASLKRLAFYLPAVLFLSSALFSWLFESYNFMPLVFVLAVAAGDYVASAGRAKTVRSEVEKRRISGGG